MIKIAVGSLLVLMVVVSTNARSSAPFFPKTHPSNKPSQSRPATGLPALVGTWKQVGQETLWSISPDGSFRVHGVFMGKPYRGKLDSIANDRFTITAPTFSDEITARVEGNRLHADGRLGPTIWSAVWRPGSPAAMREGDRGACDTLPNDEVAAILLATIEAPKGKALKDRRAQEGCNYVSNLTRNDRVALSLVGGDFTFNQVRERARNRLPLTGLDYDAFAVLEGGILTGHILRGKVHMKIELRLVPEATQDDLDHLNRLAKIAVERLRPEWV